MNSSKNTLKNKEPKKKKQRVRQSETEGLSKGQQAVIAVFAVCLAAVAAMVAWENLKPNYLLNIDGKKYKQEDLMYEIYDTESSYSQMEQLYAQIAGYSSEEFWNYNDGSGTMADSAKTDCQEAAVQQRVLYDEAVKAEYKVTEEESKQAKEDAKSLYDSLSDEQKKKTGFTKAGLQATLEEYAVTDRFRQDKIDGLEIDEEAIKETVNYDDYREYQLEYFRIGITETDDEGNTKEVDTAVKQEYKTQLETVLQQAQASEDWSKVLDTGEVNGKEEDAESQDAEEKTKVTYGTSNISKQNSSYSEELTEKLMKLSNGEITEIIEETEDAYYVFRMKENDSSAQYDSQVESQITQAENEGFEEIYNELLKGHEVKIYDDAWKNLTFGGITK